MIRIQDVVKFVSGSPQFRIKEVIEETAPLYTYYGQPEIEDDLVDIDSGNGDNKQLRTFGKVNTVESGDVLFSLISGKATIVRKIHRGYLYTQNYVKIEPSEQIDAQYLVYLINEDKGIKRQFQIGLQGSITLKYTLKQVKDLVFLDLPPIEKQRLIGELYFNQLRLQALRNRVANSETTIVLGKLKEASDK